MRRYLRNASPEVYFLVSALIGAAIAGLASRIPLVNFGFLELFGILLGFDVVTYIAMKAGWIRTPRQRSGIDQ